MSAAYQVPNYLFWLQCKFAWKKKGGGGVMLEEKNQKQKQSGMKKKKKKTDIKSLPL